MMAMMSLVVIMPLMGCDGCGEEPPVTPEPTGQFVLNDCGESYTIFWYEVMPRFSTSQPLPDAILPAYYNGLPITIIGYDFMLRRADWQDPYVTGLAVAVNSVTIPYTVEVIDNRAFYGFRVAFDFNVPNLHFEDNSRLQHIGDSVFHFSALRSIDLPEGLLTIGSHSFANNRIGGSFFNSFNLVLPDSLERILNGSFSNMNFRGLYLGKNLEYIAETAFHSSNEFFANITLHEENRHLWVYQNVTLLTNCMTLLLGNPGNPIIPHGTLRLGSRAFYRRFGASAITPPIIPPSIESIGDDVFSHFLHNFRVFCDSLVDILRYRRHDQIGQVAYRYNSSGAERIITVLDIRELEIGEYNSFVMHSPPSSFVPAMFTFLPLTYGIEFVVQFNPLFFDLTIYDMVCFRVFDNYWNELYVNDWVINTNPYKIHHIKITPITTFHPSNITLIVNPY